MILQVALVLGVQAYQTYHCLVGTVTQQDQRALRSMGVAVATHPEGRQHSAQRGTLRDFLYSLTGGVF